MAAKVGLVLTGGGARGAYQAGVLYGVSKLVPKGFFPFPIISGISAGSINAAFLACSKGSFQESAKRLWDIWWNLKSEQVFLQSKKGFVSMALRVLANIALGHRLKSQWPESLLDNSPLQELLTRIIDADAIDSRIKSGDLQGVCLSATNFTTGLNTNFFEAHEQIEPWLGKNHIAIKTRLDAQHVMASAAIPLIFRLVEIENSYYGDGSTRVAFPIAPAVRLGADRIVAIDMRFSQSTAAKRVDRYEHYPQLGEIFASLLEALFSDALDQDLRRLQLINRLVENKSDLHPKFRTVTPLLIRPSKNLALMTEDIYDLLSKPLRSILKVLEVEKGRSKSLVSHLAFEGVYTKRLLELGYADALSREDELVEFLVV
jgi:NTE family protein